MCSHMDGTSRGLWDALLRQMYKDKVAPVLLYQVYPWEAYLALLGLQSVAMSAGCGGEALPALQCVDGGLGGLKGYRRNTPDEELRER